LPDYIVIGGGSAGCALAGRLCASGAEVLLLEAGPADRDPYIHAPAGFFRVSSGPLTWDYRAFGTAEDKVGAKYAQGRVLGGGSSVNAQVFTRGQPADFDGWATREGCEGWSFEEALPYFLRSENNDTFRNAFHSDEGAVAVGFGHPHPLSRAFVRAGQEYGWPFVADFNGPSAKGVGYYQVTARQGRRSNAVRAYLRPASSRPNLKVRTGAFATRIVIEAGRAVGVVVQSGATRETLRAEREVVVCAGAIGSPRLLMLSGVGAARDLEAAGVDCAHDLPGVGRNLQDHWDVDVVSELKGDYGLDRYKRPHWRALAALQYLLFRSGPAASNIVEAGAFCSSRAEDADPDLQFHFLPGAGVEAGVGGAPNGFGCTLNSYYLRPRSRGAVKLVSADPTRPPEIRVNALSEPHDLAMGVAGVEISRDILSQPALARLISREIEPGPQVRTRAQLEAFVLRAGRSAYHPVGTCRMGRGDDAVVDPQLRVRGLENLRVCDSSVMPALVSSNTNATTIMIAEKAADLILGRGGA
jgi:choline dehydrogenase